MAPFFAPDRTETDRFVVRSWMPGDGRALNEAIVASYEHLRPTMPWAVPSEDVDVTEERVRESRARYLLNEDFVLGILDHDGRVLGGCGYHLRHGGLHTRQCEIGMWIRGSEAGGGLGTAVLAELVRWGFQDWPWRRLLWGCNELNVASQRVAEKCGFHLEARFQGEYDWGPTGIRDGRLYALLKP